MEGDSTGFVEVDVGASIEDDGVGRLSKVSANGKLVGLWYIERSARVLWRANGSFRDGDRTHHGTADGEHGSLLASKLGDTLLQLIGSRILLYKTSGQLSAAELCCCRPFGDELQTHAVDVVSATGLSHYLEDLIHRGSDGIAVWPNWVSAESLARRRIFQSRGSAF